MQFLWLLEIKSNSWVAKKLLISASIIARFADFANRNICCNWKRMRNNKLINGIADVWVWDVWVWESMFVWVLNQIDIVLVSVFARPCFRVWVDRYIDGIITNGFNAQWLIRVRRRRCRRQVAHMVHSFSHTDTHTYIDLCPIRHLNYKQYSHIYIYTLAPSVVIFNVCVLRIPAAVDRYMYSIFASNLSLSIFMPSLSSILIFLECVHSVLTLGTNTHTYGM